jgi:hypothetical protein
MKAARTTIVLGAAERRAAKKLAVHWGVTPSAAIRRAILKVEAQESQPALERRRRERIEAFDRLVASFDGYDPAAELQRIREDRETW